jgi:hypothetical protein
MGLEPLTPETTTRNITGRCGGAVVRVMGITTFTDKMFASEPDEAKIIVRNRPMPELNIKPDDYTGLACIHVEGKTFILIWGVCGGSACGEDYSFIVVDPKTMKILTPDHLRDPCDAKCAANLTGSALPYRINSKSN